MRKLKQWFLSLPRLVVIVLTLILTALIGAFDYVSGREVAISAFYLIPICWAGWAVGQKAGCFIAALSTAAWLVSDLANGYTYSYPAIPYWNALMLLALFLVVVMLLASLQRAHKGLEIVVQQRTAALVAEIAERKRLEVAKLQAERLAVVGTMAAQVAHEVRNPLGSITLNLDLIRKEIDQLAGGKGHPPQEGRLLVNEMRAEVRRIQHVIEDYLRFARLPKPQRQPFALNEFLEQKLAFMQSAFAQAKVSVSTDFDPALTIVNADAEQVWQATLNLIRNGLEAAPPGGRLVVGTRLNGSEALVRITDNGKGMTAEQLGRVFVPFFSTKSAGTGLGLTLVQQIASEHGGHVECESAPDQGATFTLFLPLTYQS